MENEQNKNDSFDYLLYFETIAEAEAKAKAEAEAKEKAEAEAEADTESEAIEQHIKSTCLIFQNSVVSDNNSISRLLKFPQTIRAKNERRF